MQLNPGNTLSVSFELYLRNAVTGALTPVIDGATEVFLAVSDAPDAVAAAGLTVAAVYVGGANGFKVATWMGQFLGATLTVAALAALPAKMYLICKRGTEIRVVVMIENVASRYASLRSTP